MGKLFKMSASNNLLLAFSLAQGGEFAFVLFSFATQHHILTPQETAPFIVAVALSMALTPLLMLINEKLILTRFGVKRPETQPADEITTTSHVIIAGFGRYGSVIGRLLRAHGIYPTVLDINPDQVNLLRRLGLNVFYGDASRLDLLQAAGIENAQLLIIALDNPDTTRDLVETVRKHYPQLKILARSTQMQQTFELEEMIGRPAYPETRESSLLMGEDALKILGYRAFQAHRMVNKFQRRDREISEQLALVRHDQKEFIKKAREQISNLEKVMLAEELSQSLKDSNSGWDPTSLREEISQSKKNI